ncbi:hypothetical protein DA093_05285 [Vibrio rotiferianus]|nr:hypothetical protein DA095_11295 [Vibrio rotiferianus]TMX57730.1 hypothetical protein DA093_05285 [Vibrio rotiferianus]
MFVVKHNKQFNSDSQRLALSLRVELSVYGAVLKFSVCAAHTLIGRYNTESTSCSKGSVELLFVRYFVLTGVQYESYSFRSRYSAFV